MDRRRFCELIAGVAGATALSSDVMVVASEAPLPSDVSPDRKVSWAADANYPNNRVPLRQNLYVQLPLGSGCPSGWLVDQLALQAKGLTTHLDELWNIVEESGWKGDVGENVTPECCTPRFVPRWLEGLTILMGVLNDDQLKSISKPYMDYTLTVKDPASVTPSVCAWSYFGRFLPEYYGFTGDSRAIKAARTILDYADSVRDSTDKRVVDRERLGMLLSFGIWYYNQTGDKDIPGLLERCARACVDDWTNYFEHFPQDPKYFIHFPDVTAQKYPGQPLSEWTRHGVDVTHAIQYPVLYSLISGDQSGRESVLQGMTYLDEAYGQVGGRWAADEWLASTDPVQGTELCDIEELLFSLETNFAVMGDVRLADRMEQLIFNAFPGTCTADMWSHQYDQQANQILVSVAKRPWHGNSDTSNIYGFTPNFPCCLANMHSPWPRYVESMWMATGDKGLVAVAYGPCRFNAKVAEGRPVEILEETDYPFSDRVRVTVHCKEPLSFPLHFRIPSWSDQPEITIAGNAEPSRPQPGTVLKVDRQWKDGDVVTLHFNYKVRAETRRNNAVAIAWGPLYFVLRIGESFEKIPGLILGRNPQPIAAPAGCVDWRIAPTTDWNYALSIDRTNPQCDMTFHKISSIPYAQKGEPVRAPGSNEYLPWADDVPIIIKVKAKLVPEWEMEGANSGPVPVSPITTRQPETVVELIPYGCSRLRIAEFPTV